MHHAIVFPPNVRPIEDNMSQTSDVYTGSDDKVLQQASDRGRLRCPGCLDRLIVVRSPAVNGPVSHFRHEPGPEEACLFRCDWDWPEDENVAPTNKRGKDPGKIVERLLLRALQRNLTDRTGVEIRSKEERLPKIEIDGLERQAEILSLARGDQGLWTQPFNGRREDRETLFFVAGWDLRSLSQKLFDTLLPARPWIVVWPWRPGNGETRFALISEPSECDPRRHPIADVDVAWIDYQRLLGVERGGDVLFIRKPYRLALERLEKAIGAEPEGSKLRTLFHLVAKILLVDGAAIHRSVFDEDLADARKPYRWCKVFPTSDQLLDVEDFATIGGQIPKDHPVSKDPLLLNTVKEFINGFLKELLKRSEELEGKVEKARSKLESIQEKLVKSESKSERIEAELDNLAEEKRELEQKVEKARSKAKSIQQKLVKSESKVARVEAELDELNDHKRELEQEVEKARSEAQSNQKKLEGRIEDLRTENRILTKKKEAFEALLRKVRSHWLGRRILKR